VHVQDAHPDIADMPAREVTPHQIASMIRKVRETGKVRTAGILRNYLVAAFNTARRAPFDSGVAGSLIDFDITANPAEVIPAIPVKRGNRILSIKELKAYMNALTLGDQEEDHVLLLALLCGGQRMAQLLRPKVRDYDQHTDILRLWDGKGKRTAAREHLLPLGPKAIGVIKPFLTKRRQEDDKLFGVSGRTISNRVSELSKSISEEPFDLRDVRRTCETMLASIGIHKDTRSQLLSHGISGVQSAHYDRHDYIREKRETLIAWEARLEEILAESIGNI
jgi:integrase